MPSSVIYIPIRRKLYDDIVRFSDGQIDPATVAENQLEAWVAMDLEFGHEDNWGDRFEHAAAEYAPHLLEQLEMERAQALARNREQQKPLVWKSVSIPAGTEVRMAYGGTHKYAKIERGSIVDAEGSFSPSEWASKVAGGTSRNAWRDLWFREPNTKIWVQALMLREQARQGVKLRTFKRVPTKYSVGGDRE